MSTINSDQILQFLQESNYDPNAIAQGMQQYGVGIDQIQQAGGWADQDLFNFVQGSGNDYLQQQFQAWRPDWGQQAATGLPADFDFGGAQDVAGSAYTAPVSAPAAATDTTARDRLAEQIRTTYQGPDAGSGSWTDAGVDHASQLADLLILNGVTELGDLSFVDTPYEILHEGGTYDMGDSQGQFDPWTESGVNRQLKIGDQLVGYLGDYNNDGTFGSKRDQYLQQPQGQNAENLLGWSARGEGNTSYRVITDPVTGALSISPGWNSSKSDLEMGRHAVIAAAAMLAGGYGISLVAAEGAAAAAAAEAGGQLTAEQIAAAVASSPETYGLAAQTGAGVGDALTTTLAGAGKGAGYSSGANAVRQLADGTDISELNWDSVMDSAATGALTGGIGAGVGAVNPAGMAGVGGTAGNVINSGIASGLTATALGGDSEEILRSIAAGGVGGAGGFNVTDVPAINNALSAGVRAEIMGKDGWEAALASGLDSATGFVAKEYSIPQPVVNAAVSLARGDPAKAIEALVRYGAAPVKKSIETYFQDSATSAAYNDPSRALDVVAAEPDPYDGLQVAASDGSSPLTGDETPDAYGLLPSQKGEIAQYLSSFTEGQNKDISVDAEGAYRVYDPDNSVFYHFSSDGSLISTGLLVIGPGEAGSTSPEARSFIDAVRAATGDTPIGTGGGTGNSPNGDLGGAGEVPGGALDEQDLTYRALFALGYDPTEYYGDAEAFFNSLSGNYQTDNLFPGLTLISESSDGQQLYRTGEGGYTIIAKASAPNEEPLWVELALDSAGQVTDSKTTTAPPSSSAINTSGGGGDGGGSGAPGGGDTLDTGEDSAGGTLGGGEVGGDTGASGSEVDGDFQSDAGTGTPGTGTGTSGTGGGEVPGDGTGGGVGPGTGLGGTGPNSSGGPGTGPGTGTGDAGPGQGSGLPGDGLGTIPGPGTGAEGEGTGGPGTGTGPGGVDPGGIGPGGTGGPGSGTGTGPGAGPGDGTGLPGTGDGKPGTGGNPEDPPDLKPPDVLPPDVPPIDIPVIPDNKPVVVTPRVVIPNPNEPGPGGVTWPEAQQQAAAAGVPYLANVFYFQAIDPGDTQAASVTDFQGQRKRLEKAAGDRKKRLYAEQEVEENAEKPETKIADMLRLIMQDDGDDESWLRSIVGNA